MRLQGRQRDILGRLVVCFCKMFGFNNTNDEKRIKYKMGQFKCMYEHYFHDGRLLWRGDENGVIEQYDIYGNRLK